MRTPAPIDPDSPKQARAFRLGSKRYPGPRAARDRLANAKSPTCSVWLHAGARPPIPTATLRAISDFVPGGFPFLSPAERQAAGLACLLRQMHLVDHGESRVEKDPGELSGRAALPASIHRTIAAHRRISAHRRPAIDGATTLPACAGRARSRRMRARTPGRSRRP
jgi:hypothetical protein